MERIDVMRSAFRRMAVERKAREGEVHGRTTPNPEPPGDGWRAVLSDVSAFARAGLCEVWRMDFGSETQFLRFSDCPPWFNPSGLWWRPA